jgi:hypothetical protein
MAGALAQRRRAAAPKESWSLETLCIAALSLIVVGYAFIAGFRSLTECDLGFAAALALIAGHAMTESLEMVWPGHHEGMVVPPAPYDTARYARISLSTTSRVNELARGTSAPEVVWTTHAAVPWTLILQT